MTVSDINNPPAIECFVELQLLCEYSAIHFQKGTKNTLRRLLTVTTFLILALNLARMVAIFP